MTCRSWRWLTHDPAIRESFAGRLGVKAYADYREMLATEPLDAVGVISINGVRGRVVADCLDARLHVIADKPLCTTLADLDLVESAWRRSGKKLSMLLDKRFNAPTLAARDLLAKGELGELVLAWASGPHRLRRSTRPDWMFRQETLRRHSQRSLHSRCRSAALAQRREVGQRSGIRGQPGASRSARIRGLRSDPSAHGKRSAGDIGSALAEPGGRALSRRLPDGADRHRRNRRVALGLR